jgi:hypothetical protein
MIDTSKTMELQLVRIKCGCKLVISNCKDEGNAKGREGFG